MIDLCLSFNKLTVFAGSYYAVCVFSQQYGAAKPFGERLFFGKWIVVGDNAIFYFNDILNQLPVVDDNPIGCYPSCHIKKSVMRYYKDYCACIFCIVGATRLICIGPFGVACIGVAVWLAGCAFLFIESARLVIPVLFILCSVSLLPGV